MSGKILFFFFITQVTFILSQNPQKCKHSDKACLLKAAQSIVPTITDGISELGMESLDVMHIDKIVIDIAGLKLSVRNTAIKGLRKAVIEKIDLNMEKKELVLGYKVDLIFMGKYKASGRLIILPIVGDGDCTIITNKLYVEMTMPFDIKKNQDGKSYLWLKRFSFNFDIRGKAHFDLTNLFDGNKALSVPLLNFMNENWKLVAQEFGLAIMEKPHNMIFQSIKKYLASQPLENIID